MTTTTGFSLLKSICRQSAMSAFRRVNPEHFVDPERPCYDFVAQYTRSYGRLPSMEALNDNGFNLIATRDNEPADYYLDRMAERFVVLSSRNILPDFTRAVNTNDHATVRRIVGELNIRIRQTVTGGAVISLAAAVQLVREAYDLAATRPGIQGITYGYHWLDEITGGLQGGDSCIMGARTGMGKSYFLNHMSMSAWEAGASVLYISNEMTAVQMATRFIGQYTGISPDYIRRGTLSAWTRDRFYTEVERIGTLGPFTIVDGSFKLKISDVDNLVQEFNPDVVYIDASYLLIPEEVRFTAKGHDIQREISKEIKRVALSRHKPILHTVQLNREAVKKKSADLDDTMISGSDGLMHDATTTLILTPGDGAHEHRTRDITVLKNREGAKGWMRANFLFDPMDFSFITSSSEEAGDDAGLDGWNV